MTASSGPEPVPAPSMPGPAVTAVVLSVLLGVYAVLLMPFALAVAFLPTGAPLAAGCVLTLVGTHRLCAGRSRDALTAGLTLLTAAYASTGLDVWSVGELLWPSALCVSAVAAVVCVWLPATGSWLAARRHEDRRPVPDPAP
ncbi:hypothetical protein [Modestobacter sp. Leaf380]|uniref:hypothetical protein n=1 Tax=Modestobacter sp. Leaf380 TaxID=1736356 RepID=UPI0006F755A4|nr:hypothetical protein [Modestobacter sp. Leaf380]KQS64888.1 hypothetical protein ASG41_15680 [Modestobacter sp. Leaf380]